MSKIPIIVLQYGKFDLTEACFRSLREQTIPVEIVLVDGNSPDKDQRALEKLGKLADRSILLDKNLGYAGANNVAITLLIKEGHEFFMVLNNDTLLKKNCIELLLKKMKEEKKIAQVCPQVLYPDGRLQAAGADIKMPFFEPRLRGHLENIQDYQQKSQVRYAPGMAVLVRSEAIREVGCIPEQYFMYGEDVDWSLILSQAGWSIWYAPEAVITHYDSASMGSFSNKKGLYLMRSNVMLARKWLKGREWAWFVISFTWKLLKQSFKLLHHTGYVKGMWQGAWQGLVSKS